MNTQSSWVRKLGKLFIVLAVFIFPNQAHIAPVRAAGLINVQSLGAKGDGLADDRSAINSALSQGCFSGSAVYFPVGTYKISSPLNSVSGCNMTLYGDGSSSSVIILVGPGSSTYSPVLGFSGANNAVTVHDLGLNGQNIGAVGLQFQTLYSANVYNVIVKNFGTPGYAAGHHVEHDGLYAATVENLTVTNSVITGNERSGIEMIPVHTATINGNILNGNGYYAGVGEQLTDADGPHQVEFLNNIAKNNGSGGFDVETGDGTLPFAYGKIHGNDIEDNGNDMWTYGIGAVIGHHAYGEISNNIVHNFAQAPKVKYSGYGSAIIATPSGSLVLSNNYQSNSGDYGVIANGTGYPGTIIGNWFSANPSYGLDANTFSGGTMNNNYVYSNSTGNIAISGCSSCAIGPNFTAAPADTVAPTAPPGLAAQAASRDQINLSWNDATDNIGVKGYLVYRNGTQIATTAGTQYPDTGLNAGTSYVYTVAAVDGLGNVSVSGNGVPATTLGGPGTSPDIQAPTVPANLTAVPQSASQINLSWAASTDNIGVAGYKIYRGGSQIASVSSTSYADTGLASAAAYSYAVLAYDAAGNVSGQSPTVSATTLAAPDATPPVITLIAPLNNAVVSGSVTISASATDNAAVSKVEFYVDGTLKATDATAPYSYTLDTTVLINAAHTIIAKAYDAAGNTASASETVTVNNSAIIPPSVQNLALGIIPTASIALDPTSPKSAVAVTDGDLTSANYADYQSGLQWVQLDLGRGCTLNEIKIWHYYSDARSYHDVVVQLANDPTFSSGVSNIFNTDANNILGQGSGTDPEYAESAAGKDINFSPINARYVRLWSNGSTVNIYNHYVEVQVFGTVTNSDITSPSVSVTSPLNNATVSGAVTIMANTTDNVGVAGVQFQVDGANAGTEVTSVPYQVTLDTSALSNGRHAISAIARDAAGNKTSASISVTVNNATPLSPPPSVLAQGPWTGQYYILNTKKLSFGSLLLTRTDSLINFDWGTGSPGPKAPADNFAARWMGSVNFPSNGVYSFNVNTDDGMRIWIDGTQLLNQWHTQATSFHFNRNLAAGNHNIKVEYFERTGNAKAQVSWVLAQVLGAEHVRLEHNLAYGQSGSDVLNLQQYLYDAGYLKVQPTGYFGFLTMSATRAFQKDHNLPQTAAVGTQTRAVINGQ